MNYWIEDIEHTPAIIIKVLHYEGDNSINIDTSIFTDAESTKLNTYKSEKRQLEFYYTRMLWAAFHHPDTINYRQTGKPILEKGYISISHSHKAIAIAYSPIQELGIDIEPISAKIKRVSRKFLYPKETFKTLEDLTKAWCIKEAVYKLMDMDDVFFMDDIYLRSLSNNGVALIKAPSVTIEPKFIVKKLKNEMIMAWAFI